MYILLAFLGIVVGFVMLIKGADWFVEGSSSIAKALKVPTIIIGLTIVAMGTSLPEASVSINSALAGENALAISNVVGSNIFNTLVVLGASAALAPVSRWGLHTPGVNRQAFLVASSLPGSSIHRPF